VEAKSELEKVAEGVEGVKVPSFPIDELIEAVRDTNDELLQLEELKKHSEKLKMDLIRYFVDIMKGYDIEVRIPAKALQFDGDEARNLQAVFLNGSGVISYTFTDGSVKAHRLEDYNPADLMEIFNVAIPILKKTLRHKRKEYEEISNRLTKIGKYLTFVRDKLSEDRKRIIWPFRKA